MAQPSIDFTGTSLAVARELGTGLTYINNYFQNDKAYYFKPHPKQDLFFHPDRDIRPRFRVFQGGNRSGKTESGCLEMLAFMLGERPWDGTKTPKEVPIRGRIITTSYDLIKKNIEPKIKALWPKDVIDHKKTKRGQTGQIAEIHLKNGSWLDLCSAEQEPMKLESVDIDVAWIDEPIPREHWIATTRGLIDRGGFAFLTMTPLTEPWVLDEIISKAKNGDPNYFMVQASMYDNVGYGLHEKSVKEFEESLTEEERAVRIHGEWLALQGLVYKEYRDHYWTQEKETPAEAGGHLIKPFEIPPSWPRWMGCDPHERVASHFIWLTASPKGDVFIYDEAALESMTVPEMSDWVKNREKNQKTPPARLVMRIIDPAANRKSNTTEVGINIRDQFERQHIYFYNGLNELDAGHKKFREHLKFEKTLSGYKPKMFIFDTCTGVRHAIQRYTWQEWASTKEGQNKAPKQSPTERFKHYMDCIRYVLMSNPQYTEPRTGIRKRHVANSVRTGY